MSSAPTAPPSIFSKARKRARQERAASLMNRGETASFLLEEMASDVHDRLTFLRHPGGAVLIEGYDGGHVSKGPWEVEAQISRPGHTDLDAPLPYTTSEFDLACSINSLDTINDLPGALIQMRAVLKPGGLAIATFIGGASLPRLRRAMMEAEPERTAARMHPMVDPRSCPTLLARAGWGDPVVDTHRLTVRYSSLQRLVEDLREQALGSVLTSAPPALGKAAMSRANAAFEAQADSDGKVNETFEIITLTGRNPAGPPLIRP